VIGNSNLVLRELWRLWNYFNNKGNIDMASKFYPPTVLRWIVILPFTEENLPVNQLRNFLREAPELDMVELWQLYFHSFEKITKITYIRDRSKELPDLPVFIESVFPYLSYFETVEVQPPETIFSLPTLEILVINQAVFQKQIFTSTSLKQLVFNYCKFYDNFSIEKYSMQFPNLKSLILDNCLYVRLNFDAFPLLEELQIYYDPVNSRKNINSMYIPNYDGDILSLKNLHSLSLSIWNTSNTIFKLIPFIPNLEYFKFTNVDSDVSMKTIADLNEKLPSHVKEFYIVWKSAGGYRNGIGWTENASKRVEKIR
jgi:hypothetical protein